MATFELVPRDQLPQQIEARRRSGAHVRLVDDVGDEPWSLHGVTVVGSVDDLDTAAAVTLFAARGASVLASAGAAVNRTLVENLSRLNTTGDSGVVDVPTTAVVPIDALSSETRELLMALASGLSISEAASRCFMSERTAHRRLIGAKRSLHVTTTVEAVAALIAHRT